MAFIGTPLDTRNTFQSLVGKRFSGDGSETEFTLDVAPASTLDIEVFVGNVRQDPNSAYTLSGTTLTFTGAPPSGTNNIYVVHQAKSVGTIGIPDDTISARTLVTLDNSNDHVLIEDATDGELKKALIPAASFAGIDDQTSSNDDQLTITDTAVVINEDSDDVDFRVESNGNANMLHVDGGNDGVAIGTTGGAHTLQVYDTTDFVSGDSNVANTAPLNVRSAASTGGIGAISIGGNDNVALYNHGANVLGLQAYTRILFMCSATNDDKIGTKSERMRIASDGEVSINDGAIGIGSTTALKIKGGNGAPTCILQHGATSGEEAVLHFKDGDATLCGSVTVHTTNHTTAYNTSSDYRLKENVDYSWDATTRLKQLKPARFNWKSNPSGDKVDGFLAHEVSSVVPEAIYGEKDAMVPEVLYTANDELPEGKNIGDVKEATKINAQGIDQSKLVPLLVKTILELEARITTLEE